MPIAVSRIAGDDHVEVIGPLAVADCGGGERLGSKLPEHHDQRLRQEAAVAHRRCSEGSAFGVRTADEDCSELVHLPCPALAAYSRLARKSWPATGTSIAVGGAPRASSAARGKLDTPGRRRTI